MGRRRKSGGAIPAASNAVRKYDAAAVNRKLGYSEKALKALEAGRYDELTGRDPMYTRSEDQIKVIQRVPALKGMTSVKNSTAERKNTSVKNSTKERKNYIDTERARKKYAERNVPSVDMEFTKQISAPKLTDEKAKPVLSKDQSALIKGISGEKSAPIMDEKQKNLTAQIENNKSAKRTGVLSTRRAKSDVEDTGSLSSRKSTGKTDVSAHEKYEQSIDHTPIGRGLDDEDEKFLYEIFDRNRTSAGGKDAILRQLTHNVWHNTKDWEEKYGKSLEQIVDDYAADFDKISEKKEKEYGEKHPVLSTVQNVFTGGTAEPAVDLEATLLGQFAPNSPLTEVTRNAAERYAKNKANRIEGVTSDMGDTGKSIYGLTTGLAERGLEYASPSKLKYLLQFGKTAENTRQSLKERGIEGKLAEVQSGLAGLTDAALDIAGFESIPALKGLAGSGNLAKEIGGRFLIGGGEQGLTEIINRAADRVFNGDKSLHNIAVQDYMSRGMTEEESENQATKDEALALAEATASGGLLNNIIGLGGKALSKAADKVPSLEAPKFREEAGQMTDDLTIARNQANEGRFGVKHLDKLTENDARAELNKRGRLSEVLEKYPNIKRHIDGTPKSSDLIEAEMGNLRQQMDNYAHGLMKENEMFDCGETPAVLKESGVKGNRIVADTSIYDKITIPEGFVKNKKGVDYHGLDKDGFEKIIRGLNDPAVTLKVKNKKGVDSVNAIINYTSKGGHPVLVAVMVDADGSIKSIEGLPDSSKIMTAHIRSGLDNYVRNNAENVKYIKGDDDSASNALWFDALKSSSPNDNTVPPIGENVNRTTDDGRVMPENSLPKNPRLVKALEGQELEEATAKVQTNKKRIKALQNEIDILKKDPKNMYRGNLKKAVQADIKARENEIRSLRGENKSLDLQMKGGLKDVKDLLTTEQKDAIYGKTDSVFSDINFAVKFAGDTPEARELAKTAQAAIRKYVNTGDAAQKKIIKNALLQLDALAKETNAEYTTQKGNVWNYNDWFGGQAQYLKRLQPVYDIYQAERAANKAATSAPVENVQTDEPVNNNPEGLRARLAEEEAARRNSELGKIPKVVKTEEPPIQPQEMPAIEGVIPERTPDNPPHTKTSEAYTNTGKRGGGWNEQEYNEYTDPSQFQYEDHTEVESMDTARRMRETEGREGFKNRVMSQNKLSGAEVDGLMIEWRDLTREAREMEANGESAKELWDEAIKVFRKVQSQESDNAQALQALAKWSRNTPEGMLVEAENILNGKTPVEKTKLRQQFEKLTGAKKSKFQFSDDFVKDFLDEAEMVRQLAPNSREANEAMARLGEMVNSQLPSNLGEKVTTFLMDNMLGNFRTLITRNAGGNVGLNAVEQIIQRPLAAGIDKLTSLKTGKRTQAGLTKEGLAEYISGFAKGIKDEAADFKTNLHTARTGENTLANAIKNNRHVFKEGSLLNMRDKLVRHGLSVGDRPFYEAVYKQTLGDYDRLRKSGQMGEAIQNLTDDEFRQYAETAASINALSAVYQNDTKLSQALLGFKESIGDLSRGVTGVDILSQFSMPFVKTPANVVDVGISYSPLGLVRNAFRTGAEIKNGAFDQNRFVNESARNIIGSALMGGAAAYASNGGISGAYSEDKDEKQAQKEAGEQEYAWNVPNWIPMLGGKQMDIGWMPVVGSNAVAAAAAQDAYEKGEGNFFANLAQGLTKGGEAMFDQSMFQGLQRLFGTGESYNSDEGLVGNMRNVVKSGLGQGIPSSWRQFGQVKDPYQRDVANSNEEWAVGSFDNYDINNLVNNLPVLREMKLAPRVNTSGELIKENQGRNVGSKILEDMILPGKITEVNRNPLAEEAKRISDITGNKTSYLPKTERKNVDTDEHKLTNQEWVDYQQKYYGELSNAGNKLLETENYKSATPEEQENALQYMYSNLKSAINSEYNGKEVSGAAKEYVNAGGGEKGVQAVVDYYNDKIMADRLGMKVSDYRKRNAESPNGAQQWYEDKQAAEDLGFVDKKGSVDVSGYEDILEEAGNKSQKMISDFPALKELGLDRAAYHTYANAINEKTDLTPQQFAADYSQIAKGKNGGVTQDGVLDFINSYDYDTYEEALADWNAYSSPEWKNKKGVRKSIRWNDAKQQYEYYYPE